MAALFVLICLSFATVVATLLMTAGLAERKYASRLELSHQADWLAEAGIDRGAVQLGRLTGYTGETWPIAAAELDGSPTAVVHIEIKKDANPKVRVIHAMAELHSASGATVQATKDVRVPTPSLGNR